MSCVRVIPVASAVSVWKQRPTVLIERLTTANEANSTDNFITSPVESA
jgi:hypothetical protein